MSAADVLVIATHPDDAEVSCGGTILNLVDSGLAVAVLDLTRGEKGSRGTVDERSQECVRATELLGLCERRNLEILDTGVKDDDETLHAVIAEVRRLRPRLLLAPLPQDAHPDHGATGRVCERAFFFSGLKKYAPELGEAMRPERFLRYFGNDHVLPSLCSDISSQVGRKRAVIECYASQVAPGETGHVLRGQGLLERTEARDRYFGSVTGCAAAEPFLFDGPLPLSDLRSLLP